MSWRKGIHGYAAKWGVVTAPLSRPGAPHLSRPARFARGCFTYDPARMAIWFMHREQQVIGRGAELSLEVWEDAYGLAFAFTPPAHAYSLVCGVADGRYAQCSVGFRFTASSPTLIGTSYVDDITGAQLDEISICPQGACPGALCWHAGNDVASLPPTTRTLVDGWTIGRARSRGLAGRAA